MTAIYVVRLCVYLTILCNFTCLHASLFSRRRHVSRLDRIKDRIAQRRTATPRRNNMRLMVTAPDTIYYGEEFAVVISLYNARQTELNVQLSDSGEYSQTRKVKVTRGTPATITFNYNELNANQEIDAFVVLRASSRTADIYNDHEMRIQASTDSYSIHIQTDKPIYKPGSTVQIRVFMLDRHNTPKDGLSPQIDLRDSSGTLVERNKVQAMKTGFYVSSFNIEQDPLEGLWTIRVAYGDRGQYSSTKSIRVGKYVKPRMKLNIDLPKERRFILPSDTELTFNVYARYIHNQPVNGVMVAKLILEKPDGTVNVNKISPEKPAMGEAEFTFPLLPSKWQEHKDAGNVLMIEVTVTESSSGETVSSRLGNIIFADGPYTFDFSQTSSYFTKRQRYLLRTRLLDATGLKAPGVDVTIVKSFLRDSGDIGTNTILVTTDSNGDIAKVFNTEDSYRKMKFTVSVTYNSGTRQGQKTEKTIEPTATSGTSIAIILRTTTIQCDDLQNTDYDFDVDITPDPESGTALTILVLSRDKIMQDPIIHTLTGASTQVINLKLAVGLVPGFKLVVYMVHGESIISDSQWIWVDGLCQNIHLDVQPKEASPGEKIDIAITGAANSYVAVSGVDSGLLQLHDNAITNKKIRDLQISKEQNINSSRSNTAVCTISNSGLSLMAFDQRWAQLATTSSGCSSPKLIDIHTELDDTSKCCNDGRNDARNGPLSTCSEKRELQRRWRPISSACADEYYRCCDKIINPPDRVLYRKHYMTHQGGWFDNRRFMAIVPKDRSIDRSIVAQSPSFPGFAYDTVLLSAGIKGDSDHGYDYYDGYEDYGDDYDLESPDVILEDISSYRTDFEETLAWSLVNLDSNGKGSMQTNARDSITEWTLKGVGVSESLGIEVSPLAKFNVTKKLFLDVHMPITVIRGEQVAIKVTVHNYLTSKNNCTVYMKRTGSICVDARPGHWSDSQSVTIPAGDTRTVSWAFVPMKTGNTELTFVVIDSHQEYDAVTRIINVEYEGVPRVDTLASFVLDKDATEVAVKLDLPDKTIVAGSERAYIRIIGNTLLPASVGAKVTDMDKMLRMPSGCGEQTLSKLGITTFVSSYLKLTNQLNGKVKKDALEYMKTGVNGMMKYRHASGAFSVWVKSTPSTWLTAFAAKTFSKVLPFEVTQYNLAKEKICPALEYVARQQKADGSFLENNRVMYTYRNYVQNDADVKLLDAAFIVIAMMEGQHCRSNMGEQNIRASIQKGVQFIEKKFQDLSSGNFRTSRKFSYALSMISYALTLADSPVAEEALSLLSRKAVEDNGLGMRFWKVDETSRGVISPIIWLSRFFGDFYYDDDYYSYDYGEKPQQTNSLHHASSIEIETASYALLAFLRKGDSYLGKANSIVRWLIYQRESGGAFRSTQDTVIAMQALSEYNMIADQAGINIQVMFRLPDTGTRIHKRMDRDNYLLRSQYQVTNELGQEIKFTASSKGNTEIKGSAQIQIELRYNEVDLSREECAYSIRVPHEEIQTNKDSSSAFGRGDTPPDHLNNVISDSQDDNKLTLTVPIYIKRTVPQDSGMAIVEVTLFSGFKAVEESLDKIWNDFALNVDKYELKPNSIVFYLSKIDSHREIKLSVKMQQEYTVAKINPAQIHVYEYYNKDVKCSVFYHPDGESSMIDIRNDGMGGIKCLEGICPVCYGDPDIDPDNRPSKQQESMHNIACAGMGKIDFVLIGIVSDSIEDPESGMVKTTVKVTDVLKNGYEELEEGDEVDIYKVICPCPKFEEGTKYLIMGGEALEGDGAFRHTKLTLDDGSYVEKYNDNSAEIDKLKEAMREVACRH